MNIEKLELEPNTLVGRLHINHDNHSREEFKKTVRSVIKHSNKLPSGYGLLEGEGGWFPDEDDLDDEVEPKSVLELWIDSEEELEAVRELKNTLEDEFDQHCVCLELFERHYEH